MAFVVRMFRHRLLPISVLSIALVYSGCVRVTPRPAQAPNETEEENTGITLSANFSFSRPTGWEDSSSNAIAFQVSRTVGSKGTLECRAGLKTLIASQSWSSCESGVFAPAKTAGRTRAVLNDNGTYTMQVRRVDDSGSVIASREQDFYVHPALDEVPDCTPVASNDAYFAAAAAYLDMSAPFGSNTSLAAPFYDVEFLMGAPGDTSMGPRTRRAISLRKEVVANSDRSLMVLRRTRAKWAGSGAGLNSVQPSANAFRCSVSVPYQYQARITPWWRSVSDGHGGSEAYLEKIRIYRTPARRTTLEVEDPGWATDGGLVSHVASFNDPTHLFFSRIEQKKQQLLGQAKSAIEAELDQQVADGDIASNPINSWANTRMQCDAVVFNAWGRGLCFHSGLTDHPIQLYSVDKVFDSRNVNRLPGTRWSETQGLAKLSRFKTANDGSNSQWENLVDTDLTAAEGVADGSHVYFLNP